jgi:hypothetical protein
LNDVVVFDEPPVRDIYVASMRSLIKSNGRMLLGATLVSEGWVHRDIIQRKLEDGRPDPSVFAVEGDSYQNVGYGITKEGLDEFAKDLTDEEKKARIWGKPAYLSGLVLKFSVRRHCRKRFEIPTDWMVDISIDVHPKKKQAVLFLATSPQNYKYFCYEIWEHGDGAFVADEIVRVVRRNAYRVNRVVIDPLSKADSNNENTTYGIIKQRLAAHGMLLEVASKDKTSGIILLNGMFETANGEPCLFVFDDLKRTIHDFEGWMYGDKGEEAGRPMKVDDDMPENAYRLALLGTEWVAPHRWRNEEEAFREAEGSVTGY